MTPGEIDDFGRIVSEFGERVELFGRLLEKGIQLEGLKAANQERMGRGEALAYPESVFDDLAQEVDMIILSFK